MSDELTDILLDIEGTTSSISFVHETLFPYARARLGAFLRDHAGEPAVGAEIERARESLRAAGKPFAELSDVIAGLESYIDEDVKDTALKAIQGMIWREGYASGAYQAHVYPEVPAALERWKAAGYRLSIYSSGSVEAQVQFFGHTVAGDLLPMLSFHFDTETGPKKESKSYSAICGVLGREPSQVLFLSDVVAELDAARAVGMRTAQLVRPGTSAGEGHPTFRDFDSVEGEFQLG